MAFPSPVKNVPREMVGEVVSTMLLNDDVKLVEAHEQPNEKFTVIPHHSSVGASSSADIEAFKKSNFVDE